ncbi:hypothetical protein Tco_1563753 [Tanacetum coccineum]
MWDAAKTMALKTDVYKKAHTTLLLCLDNKVLREVNKEDSVAGTSGGIFRLLEACIALWFYGGRVDVESAE